jgi:hypothetical protein
MFTRRELDSLILDVEFVLISVVQGVALTTLAVEGTHILREHHAIGYAFVGSGLLFVLAFWSAALIHAVSFVAWPMDLVHYFFYFALGLLECLMFGQMDRPRDWFGYSVTCYALSAVLYVYDYALMLRRRPTFDRGGAVRRLYTDMLGQQRRDMLFFIPGGLAFNAAAYLMVIRHHEWAGPLAWTQLALTLGFLANLVREFSRRQRLITEAAEP